MTDEEVRHAHHDDFYGALEKNDLAKLSQIYADEYVLVRPDGSMLSKAQILDDLKSHAMTIKVIELANERIRLYGSVGVVTGDSETLTTRDGKDTRARVRFVAVYVEQNDKIELTHFQSNLLSK